MKDFTDRQISCPHCGQHIVVSIDTTQGNQDYYEDCSVCCNSIHINMQLDEIKDRVNVQIDADDEQIF
jgi:transcription elongation factor Elf1